MAQPSSGRGHLGDRSGYAREVPRIIRSFADETSISGRDCYIPEFRYVIVTGELIVELSDCVQCMGFMIIAWHC